MNIVIHANAASNSKSSVLRLCVHNIGQLVGLDYCSERMFSVWLNSKCPASMP